MGELSGPGGFILVASARRVPLAAEHVRLAWREEREVRAAFGGASARHAADTPVFFPYVLRARKKWDR